MKKLVQILTRKQKIIFVFLVVGMFLTMIFELLGISLIVPMAYALTQQNFFDQYTYLNNILRTPLNQIQLP